MHSTKNGLSQPTRKKVIPVLAQLLADSLDLYSQCKQAHWNVRGAGFIAVHELFDKAGTEVNQAADLIAERMQQLGSSVSGTVRKSAELSRLKEYPLTTATPDQHAEALSTSIASFCTALRQSIDETASANDAVTTDMLTTIARGLDKQVWFVEAQLPVITTKVQTRLSSING